MKPLKYIHTHSPKKNYQEVTHLRFFFLTIIFFLFLRSVILAQDTLSPLARGIQKYRQGDLDGAIIDFEIGLTQEPENEKVKQYFLNSLLGLGTKYFQEKDYQKALLYLEKAYKLAPGDPEVEKLYLAAQAEIATLQPVSPPAIPKIEELPAKPQVETKPILPKEAPAPESVAKKEAAERVGKEKESKKEAKLKKELEDIIARVNRQREDLIREIEEHEKKQTVEMQSVLSENKRFLQEILLYLAVILAIFIFIILGLVYANAKSNAKVRDKFLREYEERIAKLLGRQKVGIPSQGLEQRQHMRIFMDRPTKIISENRQGEGYIIDLSLGGLCLATLAKLRTGIPITLKFTLDTDIEFVLSGEVVHTAGKYYYGIRFISPGTEEESRKIKILKSYIIAEKEMQDSWLKEKLGTNHRRIESELLKKR